MTRAASHYVTAPLTTSQAAPASTTLDAEYASLAAYDNSEVELYDIAKGGTPFYSTLTNLGRQLNDGDYENIGLNESNVLMSNNFPTYTFLEQDEKQEYYTATPASLIGATTITFASTAGMIARDIIQNVTTNEQMRITSVTNATDVVVVRAFGTVAAVAVADNSIFRLISNSIGAGVAGNGTSGEVATSKTNYFQKITTTISTTDFENMTPKFGGTKADQIKRTMKRKVIEQATKLEKALLFGQAKAVTGGVAHMGGMLDAASLGWTDDISGSLTRLTLEQAFSNPLRYTKAGRAKKIAFVGTEVMSVISNLFYSAQVRTENIQRLDLTVQNISINNGEIMFIQHPFMDSSSGYSKYALVVDPSYIRMVYPTGVDLNGRTFDGKTKFYYLADQSNYSVQKGDWVTYATLEVANSNAHGLFKIVA